MNLKPDLFKAILEWVKDNLPNERNEIYSSRDIEIENYSRLEIDHHFDLLKDSGYFRMDSHRFCVFSLTLEGYELLELMKNNTIWNKIKKALAELGLLALPTLTSIASEQLKLLLK